jgi:hypothetical protein
MFPVVNLRIAKTIQWSFQFLFNDGGVNHNLIPKRGMVAFEVPDQLILPLKDLLADETHLRQQLCDVVMAQQIAASLVVHCLHHQTVCIQLDITELFSNLDGGMEVPKVLLQSMLDQEDLVADVTRKGRSCTGSGDRCRLSMVCHVHGILSEHNATVFPLKMSSTEFTRIACTRMPQKIIIPGTMFLEHLIGRITPMAKDPLGRQHEFATQNTTMGEIRCKFLLLTKCHEAHSLHIVEELTNAQSMLEIFIFLGVGSANILNMVCESIPSVKHHSTTLTCG